MEEAIPERVGSSPATVVFRIAALAREHVVPLRDLVMNDSIDEAAEAYAEQDRRRAEPGDRLIGPAISLPRSSSKPG